MENKTKDKSQIKEIEERLMELSYELTPRKRKFVREDLYYKITQYLSDRESKKKRL